MAGKRHHIIPQMHLRYFRGDSPAEHVWTYDNEGEAPRSAITEKTSVETHFYSLERDDGTMDTTIDDYITDVEDKAAPIYRNLLNGVIPDQNQEKADFSTFLAIMYFRTTAMRKLNAELYAMLLQTKIYATATHDEAFKARVQKYEEETGKAISEEDQSKLRAAMIDPSDYFLDIPKEQTIIAMKHADALMDVFFKMKWSVLEAKHHFFITSDNPVIKKVDKKSCHPIYGGDGFANKTVEVTFPLSPKRLLLLSWQDSVDSILEIPRDYVKNENEARALHSDKYLYSHIKHKNLMKLAKKYKGLRPRVKAGGFGPQNFSEVRVPRKWKTS